MNEQKSLLTHLSETFDRYRAERRATAQEQLSSRHSGWLRALLPTPGNVLFTLLVVAGLLWASSVGALPLRAPAAAGTSTGTIAYQGRLADADGNPITNTVNMIFRLYDVATGGMPLWEEQWTGSNGVKVSDGLFNVMLGSLTPIPQSVITGHDSLFLGITVGTDDEMTPRVQLGTVPFAVQALTVPDGSVTTAKIADGAVTSAKHTISTYHADDNTFVRVQGLVPEMTISQFQFDNVPAGEVVVIATLTGGIETGASNRGAVWIEVNGVRPDTVPTHILLYEAQLTLHGRLQNFPGGRLTVFIKALTEIPESNIKFGAENGDHRFGRRVTVVAGL